MLVNTMETRKRSRRRHFIGGSDARIIMGTEESALLRLWQEKRGEVEPQDLSGNLLVQLGLATEALNRRWYQTNTGQVITDVQKRVRHPVLRWMGDIGRPGGREQCGVRGQVHAAVVVLRRSGG
jgi:predicted phage-related endonuclease